MATDMPVSFRLGQLGPQVHARIRRYAPLNKQGRSTNFVLTRDLGRYYELLESERASLQLTATDLEVCYNALHDVALIPPIVDNLAGMVVGSAWALAHLQPGYRDQLARKLVSLSPGQRWALADALERCRPDVHPQPDDDIPTRLASVGLVKD